MGKSVMKSDTKVIIAGARLSYANLFEPRAFEGQEPKYSVSILIDKEDEATVALIQKAVKNAGEAGSEKYGKKFGSRLLFHQRQQQERASGSRQAERPEHRQAASSRTRGRV